MSIYVALKYANCIKLLTDGATWDADGRLVKVASKVHTAKTLPLAVSGRGNDAIVHHVAHTVVSLADRLGSVDEAMVRFEALFASLAGTELGMLENSDCFFDLVITGHSETSGFFIKTGEALPTHKTAFRLEEKKAAVFGVAIPPTVGFAEPFMVGITQSDPRFLKLRGAEFVQAIRNAGKPQITPWGEKVPAFTGAGAGGICELTTITSTGTRTELLKDWGDPLGEPINPFREAGNVALMGNRKERRALDRQRRRGQSAA